MCVRLHTFQLINYTVLSYTLFYAYIPFWYILILSSTSSTTPFIMKIGSLESGYIKLIDKTYVVYCGCLLEIYEFVNDNTI